LQLVDAREFAGARAFAKEAYDMGRSSLAEALINLVDGYLEGKPDKIASSVKATRIPGESDVLAREINFVAGKFLASVPKLSGEVKVPTRCPECGAPLPLKAKGRVIECEYCGYPVRLD
jgi:transposase